MDRWARWQVYLFWASIAAVMAALLVMMSMEALEDSWHHVWLLAPPALLLPFTAYLYVERARGVATLAESERRYRLLIEEASDPIFISDLATRRFLDVNRRAIELTGYSRPELQDMLIDDLVDGDPMAIEEARTRIARGEHFRAEESIVRKDGEKIPIEVSVSLVSDDIVQAIVRPIGERKVAEEKLRQSEAVFRAVSEMTSDYAYSMKVGPDGSVTPEWLTGAYEKVTGYTPEESHARGGWVALAHPDDVERMTRDLGKGLQQGGSVESEFRIIAKSGDVRHLKTWARFERESPERPVVRIVGAVSDITVQKALEENLRESEKRFGDLYERLPVGVFRRSWDGIGLEANPAMVELTGYPDRETFLKTDPSDFWMNPAERLDWMRVLEEQGVVTNYDAHFKKYDGTPFRARITAHAVRDDTGNVAYLEGVVVDISEEVALGEELRATVQSLRRADTERRRLLTHLVKAKEEERNRVASDIHDDSVQVMTAIAIDLERLARKVEEPEKRNTLENLEIRVRDAVGRLRRMVFDLRPPTLDQEGLGSALQLYLEEFTIDTGIHYELKNGLDEEPDNPTRVVLYRIAQEALTNVRKHSGAARVVVKLDRRDDGITMSVSDDGKGFDVFADEIINPGHIGLSEMRERAEISGGTFDLASDFGSGTTVSVWLPELIG